MLEHERPLGPSVLFVQELAPLELVQGREQRSVAVPDTLDEVERELAPEHGRNLDGALVSGVELVDSCGQNVLHGRRNRAVRAAGGLLSCGSRELFEEEGVSLAPTDDPLGRVVCLAEDCCDDLFAGLPRERPEGDLGDVRLAEPWGVVTGAVGRQQENRDGRQLVDQLGQELLRRAVDPVRVFDDQKQRSTGFREQQLAQRLERSALQRGRIEREELSVTGRDVERVMKVATEFRVHAQLLERRADLRSDALTVVVRRDPARLPHQIKDREIGNCRPERQATTLKRDRVHLRRELQLVSQPRLAEAGVAGNADDLSLRRRGAKGLPKRLELLISPREGGELLVCLVDRGRARAAPGDAQRVDGALLDGHRVCLLEIEVPTQIARGRGTHQHISGASRPVQASCKHGRVTGGGVVHPKVVADGTDDHRTGVDPDPDVDLGSLLDRECGKRGAACVVLVCDRGAEEGHEAVAEELVDRALVAVDLGEGEREEAIDDPVIFPRANLRRQLGRADDVAEQNAHLFPFALDCAADRENLLTQMAWRVGRRGRSRLDGMPALRAELRVLGQVRSAVVARASDEQGAGDDGRDLAATSPRLLVVLRRRLRAASVRCEALDLGAARASFGGSRDRRP